MRKATTPLTRAASDQPAFDTLSRCFANPEGGVATPKGSTLSGAPDRQRASEPTVVCAWYLRCLPTGGELRDDPGFIHPGADGSRRTPSLLTCRGQRRQDDLTDVALLQLDQVIEMGSHPRGGDP